MQEKIQLVPETTKEKLLEYSYSFNKSWSDVVEACREWDDHIQHSREITDKTEWLERDRKFLEENNPIELRYNTEDLVWHIENYNSCIQESRFIKHFIVMP